MAEKLKIMEGASSPGEANEARVSVRDRKREAKATFERLWLTSPEEFDPYRNCMQALRVERTWQLIKDRINLKEGRAADLGCGSGVFSRLLRNAGADVDAVDIASLALKIIEEKGAERIHTIQDYVPYTHLKDDDFDLVLSTELIGYLPADEYRIYFSELSRLLKRDGRVVCSTLIDTYSDEAMDRFASYVETEFDVEKWVLSYHYLWTRFLNFFQAPLKFVKASKDKEYRAKELSNRKSLDRSWFLFNSSAVPSFFWRPVSWIAYPFVQLLKKSKRVLLALESISHFLWQEQGISHAIFIAKRKPLFQPIPPSEQPIERKTKKVVWE